MFWVVLFFSICILSFKAYCKLVDEESASRPAKATVTTVTWGGVLSAEETCAVCVGPSKRCRLIHPLT